ncbi:MAG: CapA family protein [Cytophagales bacterium]|nr:MAG: CapA family protein [Cytophagales bacterium]
MKTIITPILIALSILVSCNSNNDTQNSETQTQTDNKQSNIPLLVVTGFGSKKENISLATLKKDYCAGKIYLFATAKEKAKQYFGCENNKIIQSLEDFVPLAKNDELLIIDLENSIPQFKALAIDGIQFFSNAKQYPLTNPDKNLTSFDFSKNVTHFILTGVTAITRHMGALADQQGTDFLVKNLLPHFRNADLVHISNEVSISDPCDYQGVNAAYSFCTKEAHFAPILALGADIIELTGNHNLDYGAEAYKKTMQWYEKHQLQTFGGGLSPELANTPLIITLKDGKKIGFIGFNELCPSGECADKTIGANRYEPEKAKKVIEKMRKELKADLIFVGVQFSEVDAYAPTPSQTKISYELLDFGADVVYGSQAHQIQQIEFRKGKAIFHGLGNFLFDQVHRIGVRQAYFLHHYIYKGKLIQSIPVFTFMAENREPTLANPAEIADMKKVAYIDALLYKW